MSGFPFPYVLAVSDGRSMRTLHPPALGAHRFAIEAALADLVLPKPEATPAPMPKADTLTQREIAQAQGFTGDACPTCGQFAMKRAGTCLTCSACGSTTGCG